MYKEFMRDKEILFVAIDLDDTLLTDENKITPRTERAIRNARARGIFVVIATGRMYATAKPVCKALNMGDVPMILYSGGTIQRAQSGKFISKSPIDLKTANEIIKMCRDNNWYVQAYVNDELLVETRTEKTAAYEKDTGASAKAIGNSFSTLPAAPIKLLVVEPKETLEHVATVLKKFFGHTIQAVRSKDHYLEIISKNVSKGEAMLALANRLGVTQDHIMAFGNAPNDISMLEESAVAVAMGNSDKKVKAIADIIADTNNEDGVAKIIEEYLLKPIK